LSSFGFCIMYPISTEHRGLYFEFLFKSQSELNSPTADTQNVLSGTSYMVEWTVSFTGIADPPPPHTWPGWPLQRTGCNCSDRMQVSIPSTLTPPPPPPHRAKEIRSQYFLFNQYFEILSNYFLVTNEYSSLIRNQCRKKCHIKGTVRRDLREVKIGINR
jgi:hypothetical protein